MGLDVIDASCGARCGQRQGTSGTVVAGTTDAVAVSTAIPYTTPATAAPRQAGDEARTDGIGDPREHGADAAELAFHVNKIPISAAIEGRGAQDMVALVLRRRVGPIRASHPHTGGNRRWTC
jgi:hypothetical protein